MADYSVNIGVNLKKLPRFSYPYVFKPKAPKAGEEHRKPKYELSIIIPKAAKADISALEEAIQQCLDDNMEKMFGGKINKKTFKFPLHDGDEEKEDDEAYANSMYLSARSVHKPKVVDADVDIINDETEFYAGCYGRVVVSFFAYHDKESGGKGIGCSLGNIQKLKDGEPLGGGGAADPWKDFSKVDVDDLDDDDFMK